MGLIEIKINYKILAVIFLTTTLRFFSQISPLETEKFKPDPEREKMFLPYLAVKHGGLPATEEWKKSNTVQYYKELWYFTESFYVKRDYFKEGVFMDEAMIDITRFDADRKVNVEEIVVLPGYKDILVLLPLNKLKYKPEYK